MSKDGMERISVRDNPMDADDWEYLLAGHLVGSDWVFPEIGVDTIGEVRQTSEKSHGQRVKYPEIVLKYNGMRMSVSGFLRRIDPNDVGDIDPSDRVAKQIVRIHEESSWRSMDTATEREESA